MRKLLFLLVGLGLVGGLVALGLVYTLALRPNTPDFEGTRTVKIPPEASFETVLDSLEARGIVASRASLGWVGRTTGWGGQVKAGHYAFEAGLSTYDLLQKLRRGLQEPVRLTIPPGTRPEVVAAVAAREMAFEAEAFLAALADSALAADLGTDPVHLFGYMMPETYFFYWLTPPETVIRRVKEAFDDRFEAQVATAPLGLSKEEIIRLAAIVEWEARLSEEKAAIAGVYVNRLEQGWLLQADPTVQYGLLEIEGQKRRLFFADYELDHPYNTYRIAGLPPGPITNPAPSSVEGALNPADHRYFYFVANGDGSHTFSRTLAEHNRAADRYRALMRERRASQRSTG
ncbi:MAG: endolytic transglycosylase MltG [Bacteroidota bacterium]